MKIDSKSLIYKAIILYIFGKHWQVSVSSNKTFSLNYIFAKGIIFVVLVHTTNFLFINRFNKFYVNFRL